MQTLFYCLGEETWSDEETNKDFTISFTWKNSKYFSIFNSAPPASWIAQIAKGFLTCYSFSYAVSCKSSSLCIFSFIFKEVKNTRKTYRESKKKHLQIFSLFSTVSLHHKWNGTRFSLRDSEYTSCLIIFQTI